MGEIVQTLGYDAEDRVVEETLGGASFTMSYASAGGSTVSTVTDPSGNVTEWTFGTFAMPTSKKIFTKGLRTGEPTSFDTTYGVSSTTGLFSNVTAPTP